MKQHKTIKFKNVALVKRLNSLDQELKTLYSH